MIDSRDKGIRGELELAEFLTERGALVDAHSAARLGMIPKLSELVAAEPGVVHARGGDGRTPLHFASTVDVAKFLLENGAEIDARDRNHESTPAQHMLRVLQKRHYAKDRQDVARYLVSRGCCTDILMAAALGDTDRVRQHLDTDPGCIRMSVSEEWFPKRDPRAGGTIYIWMLGPNRTAHAVARDFGHEDVFQLLMDRTPQDLKLALACELGDESAFQEFLAARPDVDPSSITAYGKGGMGVALLHAAALDRRITRVVVEDTPESFHAILDEPLHRNAPEIVIPGVLRHYDIADLVRAIAPRSVTVLNHPEPNAVLPYLIK